jgi:hypothetical protein
MPSILGCGLMLASCASFQDQTGELDGSTVTEATFPTR